MSMPKKNQTGFTLFEIVISIAILVIVIAEIGGFAVSLQNARIALVHMQEVDVNLAMAVDVMSQRIRSSVGVNSGASTFDGDPGVLSLSMTDPAVNPTIFRLSQDNGVLQMQEGASAPAALTTSQVSISKLIFSLHSNNGEPENVGIAVTVDTNSSSGSYASFTHAATTSATVRQ